MVKAQIQLSTNCQGKSSSFFLVPLLATAASTSYMENTPPIRETCALLFDMKSTEKSARRLLKRSKQIALDDTKFNLQANNAIQI